MTGASGNGSKASKWIDLRSDTVTRPTPGMKAAMMDAEVGDDVWGDDPTVNELQAYAAQLFGKEAALFCPSGTMTNQIAIKVHTQPGDELICADNAHIYLYEGGGIAFNSGVQPKLLPSDRGRISAAQIAQSINMEDSHFPTTRLVCLENTANKGGGAFYSLEQMQAISTLCRERGLRLHLDGARLFNAFVEAGYGPGQVGPLFDSISICLSKGLGCPVGSLLLGTADFIRRAHRIRKVLGGGMRQAGFLAAAGLYALQNNVERLRDDHRRARRLGAVLSALPYVGAVAPVDTNIAIFTLAQGWDAKAIVESLKSRHILISTMAPGVLRLVTHLDVGDEDIDAVVDALQQLAATGEGKAAADGATAGGKAGGGAVGTQGGLNGSGGCGYGASPAAVASGAAAPGANAGTGSSE
ncbi:hypothetical protein CHLRE_10g423550v5 [Chlamydomonas reinhardtii]|uniref:Aromatic amino acid beta-eliminating lyase/threonine aldolase domain-containing protein n=1 Tax=Chlamydomonas reinhardtii TaxID=3055 RepID=A8ICF1_CHLRE|nr:uncharacterized protein CHLRE_10g423550v5 [Chlamydomonas reinhardtii]PNW77134.1 hypothetical protein CHLRE_10g423550v5 [Chlamydomonas reinhardtii]|eukprot:XP_001702748.1 threonine aldolase family protein [Chlamydomonas reinhardtii]